MNREITTEQALKYFDRLSEKLQRKAFAALAFECSVSEIAYYNEEENIIYWEQTGEPIDE